jgi:hypothetical protein
MDVSDRSKTGESDLLETVVNLTGLPDPMVPIVYDEIDQILQVTGQDPRNLTLDDLRHAMLLYLEKLQEDGALGEDADLPECTVE